MTRLLLSLCFLILVANLANCAKLSILETDCSFYPKITLVIRLAEKRTGNEELTIFEDGRKIRSFRKAPVVDTARQIEVTFLSAARRKGKHEIIIEVRGQRALTTYTSGRWRRLGKKKRNVLRIRATGPGWLPIPCRFTALHESGRTFEDFVSKGGYGRLGTGFIAPPGSYHTELRLNGLDVPVDHFRFEVKTHRPTYIHRRFGFLNLPGEKQNITDTQMVHIEIEKLPSRFPSIRRNLADLQKNIPKSIPRGVIPLPPGTYEIRLRDATPNAKISIVPLRCKVEVVVGQRTPFPAGLTCK